MSLLIFSHANGFPASVYRVLFKGLRARGFTVKAVDKFGHHPDYPPTNNWPHLVQQLVDFTREHTAKAGEPAFLVGHSLGGFLSVMAAARHPELARAVVLLDSPILGGWRATTLGVIKRTQLMGSVSPGVVSRRRRTSWPSAEAALAHFRTKKVFAHWDAEVLEDYAHRALVARDGEWVLDFDRDVETAIYNTLPDNLDRLLARHPLKCPVAFVGGRHSQEMKQVGMAMTDKLTKGRITILDGSHLFPMENPRATAAAIEANIWGMRGGISPG